jgi:hypothetical protein
VERKGLNKVTNNRYVTVENSGSRPLITRAINVIDSLANTLEIHDTRLVPVVKQGKSIVSVMNNAKKNLNKGSQ